MKAEQISIFLENSEGRLAEVTSILHESGVNIKALSLADTTDFGVLRLIVDDNKKAEESLKKEGFTVGKTSVVAVEVENKPGGLNAIVSLLGKSQINVEYMYAFVPQMSEKPIMIFRFDHIDKAIDVLKENDFNIISDIYSK